MGRLIFWKRRRQVSTTGVLRLPGGWYLKLPLILVLVILLNILVDTFVPSDTLWFHRALPIASANEVFRFQYELPWGSLQLDGRPLTYMPRSTRDTPLTIMPGRHTLTLIALPFPAQNCTFIVPTPIQMPDAAKDACRVQQQAREADASPVTVLSFPVYPSLSLLNAQQQIILKQATQDYLDTLRGTALVHVGEPYRTSSESPLQLAHTSMQAQMRFTLDTDVTQAAQCRGPTLGEHCQLQATGQDCRLYCSLPLALYNGTTAAPVYWEVAVVTRPSWIYGNSTGQAVVRSGTDQQYTLLFIRWEQGRWVVKGADPQVSPLSNPVCALSVDKVVAAAQALNADRTGMQATDWTFTSGRQPVQGCVASIALRESSEHGSKVQPLKAYLLWRFNVLLAVGIEAQRLFPNLPRATADGVAITAQILREAVSVS